MKKIFIIIIALLAGLSFVSCGTSNLSGEVEVEDLIGRTVKVNPGKYERVVCIGAGALRVYSYIGDVTKLAGVEDIDNTTLSARPKMFDGVARPYQIAFKNVFNTLPSCGVGGPQSQVAETEKILSCNPDIIVSEYEDKDKANKLQSDLNVPVIVVSYGSNGVFDERMGKTLNLLGKVFAKESRSKTINDFIASEKAAISNRVKDIDVNSQKKVYVMGLGNWATTNHLMTAQNYAPFNVAKINNVVTDLGKNGVQDITAEKFEALAPSMDIMIMDVAAVKNIKKLYQENPNMFDNCKAWNDGEVYIQLAYNVYYTNVEIALVNTWYNAMVVYPELFSDINIKQKLSEVTTIFLGKDLSDEIYAYPMSFGGYRKVTAEIFA